MKIFNITDNLNYDSSKVATNPQLCIYNNELYCIWQETNVGNNSQIKVKKYNGSNWINVSECLNYDASKDATFPALCIYNNELYCCWCETNGANYQIKIKKYNGTIWINVNNNLNCDSSKPAQCPNLCIYNNELYCTWNELSPVWQIKIKKYNGNSWINVTDNLNYDGSKHANYPKLCIYNNELYCVWIEINGINYSYQIKIKKYNGSSWINVTDNLNYDGSKPAQYPYLSVYKDELYCVWCETNTNNISIYQIKMKKYNGSSWINVTDNLNYDSDKNANSPNLSVYKDELYCAWCEYNTNNTSQIKIKKYDGANWVNISDCLNYNNSKHAGGSYLCVHKDELYCAWCEVNGTINNHQIKIKKCNGNVRLFLIKDTNNYYGITGCLLKKINNASINSELEKCFKQYGSEELEISDTNKITISQNMNYVKDLDEFKMYSLPIDKNTISSIENIKLEVK